MDLTGATYAYQEISVKVGTGKERPPIDGEDDLDGGSDDDHDGTDNETDNGTSCPLTGAVALDRKTAARANHGLKQDIAALLPVLQTGGSVTPVYK